MYKDLSVLGSSGIFRLLYRPGTTVNKEIIRSTVIDNHNQCHKPISFFTFWELLVKNQN